MEQVCLDFQGLAMIFVSSGWRGLARFVEYSSARENPSTRGVDLSRYNSTPCLVVNFNTRRNTLTVIMADGTIRDDIVRTELEEWR